MRNKELVVFLALALAVLLIGNRLNKTHWLIKQFGSIQGRDLDLFSINEVSFSSVGSLDFLEPSASNHPYYSPDKPRAVGLGYDWLTGKYKKVLYTTDLDLDKNYELIQMASDYYQSDSTYLDGLSGGNSETVFASIYRKTGSGYLMWKEDIVRLSGGKLKAKTIEMLNADTFQ